MQAVTVCVEYSDLLAFSLSRNAPHFERMVVVTAHHDAATRELCEQFPSVVCLVSDVMYRDGAKFNKGAAISLGLDLLVGWESDGWFAHVDADTILPPDASEHLQGLAAGYLYSAPRRMLREPRDFRPDLDWHKLPVHPDREHAGYLQIWHASDPCLGPMPWYPRNWKHAGGSDSEFCRRWPRHRKLYLPMEVLHLGPDSVNWCGRVSAHIDGTVSHMADERRRALEDMLAKRMPGRRRFEAEKLQGGR